VSVYKIAVFYLGLVISLVLSDCQMFSIDYVLCKCQASYALVPIIM